MTPPSSTPSFTYAYPQQFSSLASLTPLSLSSAATLVLHALMAVFYYHVSHAWKDFLTTFEDGTSSEDEHMFRNDVLDDFCKFCKTCHEKTDFVYSHRNKQLVKDFRRLHNVRAYFKNRKTYYAKANAYFETYGDLYDFASMKYSQAWDDAVEKHIKGELGRDLQGQCTC